MINKEFLKQIESINNELLGLKKRLKNLENKECTSVKDSVRESSTSYKYNDCKSWVQIMFLMNYKSEEKARIKLKRFLEKNSKCTFCTVAK